MALIFLTMARLRLPFDMHFTQKTYYFQKIVTSPFLCQKLRMTHQNVRKKKGFYPIIITCLLCLLFLKKNGVDVFDNGEVTASLRYAFHTKKILFPKNCHVAVSGSKVTYDPSKCSQERGLLPYYNNLFVMFVIFEKKWRFFDNGEVTASLRYAFHTKNILFSKNCHVAVSWSKVTNDPSKCSQERGLLPYYHNLFVMFVIFEKNGDFGKKRQKRFQC